MTRDSRSILELLFVGTLAVTAGCQTPGAGSETVSGTVTAGPTCPVESESPDLACDDRPVAGAVLVVQDLEGREVARTTSAADGGFRVELAPGSYRLVPQPVEGLMGTPSPIDLSVKIGEPITALAVSYDTGIR